MLNIRFEWKALLKDMKNSIVLVLMICVSEAKNVIHWLENHLLSCPFKQLTNIDCPGCGIQRSLLALMKGNLLISFKLYPATIPILALFIFTIVHLKFELKNGAFVIKMLYIGVALIIVINYIYKIFTNQLI